MLQGLEDVNGTEQLINQGMSQKKKVIIVPRAMGRTNGIRLIEGNVA